MPKACRGWGDVNQFGCYQTLGDLIVEFDNSPEPKLSSPSGHAAGDGKGIENTVDGDPGTKWCVNNDGSPVSWQIQFPEPQKVASYAFTSGDDMPRRDPRSWVLEGSADGKAWGEVDRRTLDKPFEKRHQTKTFKIARPGAFRYYRFTFTAMPIKSFQVAEISLAGAAKPASAAAADGYRRDLNLIDGVAHTQYRRKGVTFTRELLVSKPDEVIALRLEGRQAGLPGVHRRAGAEQNAAIRAEGGVFVLEGQLPFKKPGGGGEGMRYMALLGASVKGGKVSATDQGLVVEGADEATLIVSAGTDWQDKEFAKLAPRAARRRPWPNRLTPCGRRRLPTTAATWIAAG